MQIIPLVTGWLHNDVKTFDPRHESALRWHPVLVWLLRSADSLVLFDTGAPAQLESEKRGRYNYRQAREETLEVQLARMGVGPSDVDAVILSHMHWDHSGGWQLFAPSKLCVSAVELHFAAHPHPSHARYFDTVVEPARGLPDAGLVNTDATRLVLDRSGIQIVALPGHTPGSQGALVHVGSSRVLIAGDTVPLLSNLAGSAPHPNGIRTDDEIAESTMRQVLRIATDVLPSHDPSLAHMAGVDIIPRLPELAATWRFSR